MSEKTLPIALLAALLCGCGSISERGDWPRFRGPNGSGVSDSRRLPSRLDPAKDLAWKADVPPGNSSPVVAGGRLFLTGAEGDERIVLAFDARSGAPLWRKSLPKAWTEPANELNGPATPTPAADNESVFVFFPDFGLVAFNTAGEERWRTPLGPFQSMHGIASSPVLVEGKVVLLIDQLGQSHLEAFDAASGKPVWRAERASGVTGGYSTPSVSGSGAAAQVIVSGAFELTAYAASSGVRTWWVTGLTNAPVTIPVVDDDKVYVCEPLGEPVSFKQVGPFDKNSDGKISKEEVEAEPGAWRLLERIDTAWGNGDGLLEESEFVRGFGTFEGNGGLAAVRLGGRGDVTRTHVAWRYTKALPYVASVAVYRQVLFMVRDGGILTTLDPATGSVHKQARLEGGEGSYYASPVAGDGKVILVSERGKLSVVKAEAEWEQISSSDLGESTLATPAIAGGRVYIRTAKRLYCFACGEV